MQQSFFSLVHFFDTNLIAHEIVHGLIALPFAYFLWRKTRNTRLVALLFFVTYFVDTDHLVDYFAYFGFVVDVPQMLAMKFFDASGHIYVPLHGWEYLIVLGILTWKKGWKSLWAAILLGLSAHYIWDSIAVWNPLFYSLLMRASTGFTYFP